MPDKFNLIPDDEVIDLSSEDDLDRLINPEKHAKKNLPKATIQRVVGKSEQILNMIPDSPAFLKGIQTGGYKQSSGLFGFKQKGPQKKLEIAIERSRSLLNSFLENQAKDPRKDLKKYLDKFANSPDLQSLWAIYQFNISKDFSDNTGVGKMAIARMDEDRLRNLKKSLQGLITAIFSDCITIYYTTWFIQIYNEYLVTLNRLLKYNYSIISQEIDKAFEGIKRNILTEQKRVSAMILKKEDLESFNAMTRTITNPNYALLNLAPSNMKETIAEMEKFQGKSIDISLNTNTVITMLMNVLTLFARIPALSRLNLVQETLKRIPDPVNRMNIQKQAIALTQYVTDCKIAYATEELSLKKTAMRALYQYALDIVEKQFDGSVPTKWHANIILRIGWVAINAKDDAIFSKQEYPMVLKKAHKYVGWIISNCAIPTSSKGKKGGDDKIRQNLINRAVQSREKITIIGKSVDLELEPGQ